MSDAKSPFIFGFSNRFAIPVHLGYKDPKSEMVPITIVPGGSYEEFPYEEAMKDSPLYMGFEKCPDERDAASLNTLGTIVSLHQNRYIMEIPFIHPLLHYPLATAHPRKDATGNEIVYTINMGAIVDHLNRPASLHGMTRPSLESSREGHHLSREDFSLMKSWGASVVHLPLNAEYWLESFPTESGYGYKKVVDLMISYLFEHGMDVILSLEKKAAKTPTTTSENPILFWHDVATHYKGFKSIIFELDAHPQAESPEEWKTYYEELYQTVRNTGAENIVICRGMNGSLSHLKESKYFIGGINAINISYGAELKNTETFQDDFGFLLGRHVVFGFIPEVSEEALAFCKSKKIPHICGNWSPDQDVKSPLLTDWDGTPSGRGKIVRDHQTSLENR